ncbi:DUF5050 domain-containing protein [Vallitalea okinawensis]|uniref:DUF5050 domain-containing protein n=1 Tax=Vallitalea okinawensis TaxID=2078660 RepID=UPI000CFAFAFB|nr:DUF5050 domain-containing protein [Vallitalea okinawensis]
MSRKVIILVILTTIALASFGVVILIGTGGSQYEKKMELGHECFDEKNYEESITAYEEAIEIDEDSVKARVGMADAYIKLEDYEAAEEIIMEAIDMDEEDDDSWELAIEIYERMNKPKIEIKELVEEAYKSTERKKFNRWIKEKTPENPLVNMDSGDYSEELNIELTNLNNGDKAYYSTDGSDPMENGAEYEGSIHIREGETILRLAITNSYSLTSQSEFTYAITPKELILGNTSGNIKNAGYVASWNDWIIYSVEGGIYRYNAYNGEEKKLLDTDNTPMYLNVIGDKLYFSLSSIDYSETNIYEMDLNSSDTISVIAEDAFTFSYLVIANDTGYYLNENNNIMKFDLITRQAEVIVYDQCHTVNVIDDWIYYLNLSDSVTYTYDNMLDGTSYQEFGTIYRVKTNGQDKEKITNDGTNDFLVYNEWIYYANCNDGDSVSSEGESFYLGRLYRLNIDTRDKIKMSDDLVFRRVNKYGDYIYYGDTTGMTRLNINTRKRERLFDTIYGMEINLIKDMMVFTDIYPPSQANNYIAQWGNSTYRNLFYIELDNIPKLTIESNISSTDEIDYIIPYSSNRYLIEEDLENLTLEELALARNEIYARKGYIFSTEKYRLYFESKSWYSPNSNFSEGDLNEYEKYNAQFIKQFEN